MNTNTWAVLSASALLMISTGCSKQEQAPSASTAALDQAEEVFNKPLQAPQPVDPTSVIATVNGEDITRGELDQQVKIFKSRIGRQLPPEQLAQMEGRLKEQAMEALVTKLLLKSAIDDAEIDVSSDDVSEAISKITASLPTGVTLEQLAAQNNASIDELKENIALDLKLNKLVESRLGGKVEASDEEIETFYKENESSFSAPETVTARHILIQVDPKDDDAAKATKLERAEEVRQMLIDGADFAEVAAEYSDGPSKTRGGNLGSFGKGQMVAPFEDAAFSQEVGAIGEIVETRFGYHIIEVQEKSEAHVIPLEEAKDRIAQYLTGQKRQEAIQEYIVALREDAEINVTQ